MDLTTTQPHKSHNTKNTTVLKREHQNMLQLSAITHCTTRQLFRLAVICINRYEMYPEAHCQAKQVHGREHDNITVVLLFYGIRYTHCCQALEAAKPCATRVSHSQWERQCQAPPAVTKGQGTGIAGACGGAAILLGTTSNTRPREGEISKEIEKKNKKRNEARIRALDQLCWEFRQWWRQLRQDSPLSSCWSSPGQCVHR